MMNAQVPVYGPLLVSIRFLSVLAKEVVIQRYTVHPEYRVIFCHSWKVFFLIGLLFKIQCSIGAVYIMFCYESIVKSRPIKINRIYMLLLACSAYYETRANTNGR